MLIFYFLQRRASMSVQSAKTFPSQGTFDQQSYYVNNLKSGKHPILSPAIKAIEENPMSSSLKDKLPDGVSANIYKHSHNEGMQENNNPNETELPSYSIITRNIGGQSSNNKDMEIKTTFWGDGDASSIKIVITPDGETKVIKMNSPFAEIKKGLEPKESGFVIRASFEKKSMFSVKKVTNFKC